MRIIRNRLLPALKQTPDIGRTKSNASKIKSETLAQHDDMRRSRRRWNGNGLFG